MLACQEYLHDSSAEQISSGFSSFFLPTPESTTQLVFSFAFLLLVAFFLFIIFSLSKKHENTLVHYV
jgi:hypothetical protein